MDKPNEETEEKPQFYPGLFILIFALGFLVFNYVTESDHTNSISYSNFEKDLADKKISKLSVDDQFIYGEYTAPQNGKTQFITPRVDPALASSLSKSGVDFSGVVHHDFFATLFSWVAPAVIFLLIWFYGMRSLAGGKDGVGLMTVGRSKAKINVNRDTGVTFNDVAGIDEAKSELHEIIEFLQNPDEFKRLGARIPKGVLLVESARRGKAAAGESHSPERPMCRSSPSAARNLLKCSSASAPGAGPGSVPAGHRERPGDHLYR